MGRSAVPVAVAMPAGRVQALPPLPDAARCAQRIAVPPPTDRTGRDLLASLHLA